MAEQARRKPTRSRSVVITARPTKERRPGSVGQRGAESLAAIAYERIEDLFVHCRVAPGADIKMQELQDLVGIGRTPVHQAVRRLAAETLINIRPRDGLQISPIDLQRDRRLLQLRRDMDRFVVALAIDKLNSNQRNRLIRLGMVLRERRRDMEVHEFNMHDGHLNAILLDAADEPFLDRTLRPLHTIFRRTGNVYLTHVGGRNGLDATVDCHLDLLDAVVDRDRRKATAASDRIVGLAESMFDSIEGNIDPHLLNIGN
ncbi:GntR family transcriptional regulator [Xanthobacteraceae bacterium Astr-EGSB]|uniref:GntR family transcriptional regulator n=1 Tax=Astrobacterium formosum TaxID=3069710 RepID=UPI0027B0CCC9|nr:GntR family transcriptional regulator [Xanthobacteraceae bacterium Astr-EGSB]